MSKTQHPRRKVKRAQAWAVVDAKTNAPVVAEGLDGDDPGEEVHWMKIYGRKSDAQRNCWMGGQEVRRVEIRVLRD